MAGNHSSTSGIPRRLEPVGKLLACAVCAATLLWGTVEAADILRGGAAASATPAPATAATGAIATTAPALRSAQDRLARTTQALESVKQMQNAARNLAIAGANNLRASLPAVPVNSYLKINGLMPATGVPKDLLNPAAGENIDLWKGAKLPTVATTTTNGVDSTTVTIKQTEQQAVLNWQSFNIGKNTTLAFDQTAGGTNVSQWIAFNKVGVTGSPSQILGSIKADGQVYVINPNGIIFGGSSQVNAHALVASSLPINDNLIKRGLLNNPDAQFLFSALSLDGGKNGTPAFTPTVADEFILTSSTNEHVLAWSSPAEASPSVAYSTPGSKGSLQLGDDYTVSTSETNGKTSVIFTAAGRNKIGDATIQVNYTPAGDQYGNVEVQAGALLTAPTNADKVGGRVALVGKNVTNAGTISTPDGQAILAAGLQVGLAPHSTTDPTLRGLDVFVGAVVDPASADAVPSTAGTVTNDRIANNDGTFYSGLISAPRANVTLTGKTVNQLGYIDSSTSVAYNGRVDLVAGYNAVPNPTYDPSLSATANFTLALPFFYLSSAGNNPSADAVPNSGKVTLGQNSVLRILPETASKDRIAGDLALPSQINIQGQSVYLGTDSVLLAPGAAVPLAKAFAFDGRALEAGVSIRAGQWFNPADPRYSFVHADDTQQIYLDEGATIDVAGLSVVEASVTENIVPVELRGSELADSPLQRDGALRGQTIQVDVRRHGAWDPTLNDGLGGYTWVGTPLANTAGWVGLTTHSIGELSVNGGSVSLKAGGPVVLQKGSLVDVSGGSINYQGGVTQTTRLTGADGHIYDVANATPDHVYTGIYRGTTTTIDPKWGVTSTSVNPLSQGSYEPGYLQGGSGGSFAVSGPVLALDGTLLGGTQAGPGQRALSPMYQPASPPNPANPTKTGVPRWLLDSVNRPNPAQLSLSIGRQYFSAAGNYVSYSPTPANIVFRENSTLVAADAYNVAADYLFPALRKYELDLSPSLVSNNGAGFGVLRIDNSDDDVGASAGAGNITVKAGTQLTLSPGGSLLLAAGNVVVESGASVTASGGLLSFNAYDISPSQAESIAYRALNPDPENPSIATPYAPRRGNVSIGAGATLSTAGSVLDEKITSATAGTLPLVTAGGSIVIKGNDIALKSGSRLTAAGGAVISSSGKLSYSDAGSITLNAGKALPVASLSDFGAVLGGRLTITGAILEGYAGVGRKGGGLELQAPSILIKTLASGATSATDATTGALTLAPEFFNQGGFANFTAAGLGVSLGTNGSMTGSAPAFTLAANTTVQPKVKNWETLPGGSVFLAQEGVRKAASLNFTTASLFEDVTKTQLNNSIDLVFGTGAVIATDPGGSIALSGGTVDLLGRVTARGGSISVAQLKGAAPYTTGLHIGSASQLDASGAALFKQDVTGYYKSDVLDGGSITIAGNIAAEKGARFDVSGATDTILVPPGRPSGELAIGSAAVLQPVVKDSSGGTIALKADQLLFSAANLVGAAGGTTGQGGNLKIVSNRSTFVEYADGSGQFQSGDTALILSSSVPEFLFKGLGKSVEGLTGNRLGDAKGLGLAQIGATSFADGGFGSIALTLGRGALEVQGNVSLSASRRITVADGGVLSLTPDPKAAVTAKHVFALSAPSVVLGQPFLAPLPAASAASNPLGQSIVATNGSGVLSVQAGSLIDVGNLSLQNAGVVVLDATKGGTTAGAIRGDGTLNAAGAITLKAGQIYPPTAVTFNVIADDYTSGGAVVPGSVTIQSAGSAATPALPLSAGGTLNLFASTITQGGVLRAPVGTINFGTISGNAINPLSGQSLPVTSKLTLQPGSITSVSAVDPLTGKPLTIPYGITVNGNAWIDPTGTDITNLGPGAKNITFTATSIDFQAATSTTPASSIDLSGGGDLFAYQFVPGTGGSTDILLGSKAGAFAILPGYQDLYAPFADYNNGTEAQLNLGSDPGYFAANSKLNYAVGDRLHLEAGSGLPAGDYTLLPARYALLAGAYLVTPQAGSSTAGAAASVAQPVGATVVSGYRYNGLEPVGKSQKLFTSFEVAPQTVVLKRAQYDNSTANAFFTQVALSDDVTVPRLPVDAGRLALAAGSALHLDGSVNAKAATGGRGGLVDLSSTADILIGSKAVIAAQTASGAVGTLFLDAAALSSFGADSLLVGGMRSTDADGTLVTVTTNKLMVDNTGESLSGSDIILVANQSLILKDGAEVSSTGKSLVKADPLRVAGTAALKKVGDTIGFARGGLPISLPNGTTGTGKLTSTSSGTIVTATGTTTPFLATTSATGLTNAFSVPAGATITLDNAGVLTLASSVDTVVKSVSIALGDGTLLRVSSDPAAATTRTGVTSSLTPVFTLGTGVKLSGGSAIIDSTNTTSVPASFDFSALKALSLNSGRISVLLDQPGSMTTTGSLVLSRTAQQSLLKSASALSLLSYSTLDFYGTGNFGAATLGTLGMHAGAIRGYANSADPLAKVSVSAKSLLLDNAANAASGISADTPSGQLVFDTGTLQLGGNLLDIQNFASVTINAAGGVLTGDAAKSSTPHGGLNVTGGDLSIVTPLVAGAKGTVQSISTDGKLALSAGKGTALVTPGLAASLSLVGDAVELGGTIRLPSGKISVEARSDDLSILAATLDVGGTQQRFYDVAKYTDAGQISLAAVEGDMTVSAGSKLTVSADAGGGSAGSLRIAVPQGNFTVAPGTLSGRAGRAGQGATFSLDTVGIPGADPTSSHLATLSAALSTGGFDQSVSVRVREGDVVADGAVRAHEYSLSADHGSIFVTGAIDASGFIGSTRANPYGGEINLVNPTGGKIDLMASGSVVLAPSAWLTAAGYAYSNAGKGGAITLSAGSYTSVAGVGHADTTGVVDAQGGTHIDLGVKNAFTANDLWLNSGATVPVSNRPDLVTGTLHVRESQVAFGSGSQFGSLAGSVSGASGIVLEGFQVFDLSSTTGTVSTSGAITKVGSGGLIDRAVEKAVFSNGTAFVAAVDPTLRENELFHVQPGAELVNETAPAVTVTRNFVTLNSSVAASRSLVNFALKPGVGIITTVLIPGGLPVGVTLKPTGTVGRQFSVTTADGVTSSLITATSTTTVASTSASNPVIAINYRNTGNTALANQINLNTGSTPFTVAFDPATTIASSSFAGRYASNAGDLTLANTWDLSTYRFGSRLEPGNLKLRAKGNLVFGFDASLSDGFDPANAVDPANPLWTAKLMTGNSWSYRLVAGADNSAADGRSVQALSTLVPGSGSFLLGQGGLILPTTTGNSVTTSTVIPRYYQTVRTGTGDIDVSAGRDLQLLNPLATIYTAGRSADPLDGFDVPQLDSEVDPVNTVKPNYSVAQYGLGGGNVSLRAQNDIARYVLSGTSLVSNSSKELPSNWLYRRGNVGPDGRFVSFADEATPPSTEIQSTSWWIDYGNFFSDIGALGGGNVLLSAGRNVSNVNAAATTNARMPGRGVDDVALAPDASKLVELGGGNVTVLGGRNIDGGVYYVERGDATLRAGGAVTTNATRAAFTSGSNVNPVRWLPTTFFLGKGRIDVAAGGDIRLGAVANPFRLPQGAGNRLYETSYFSTFDPRDEVKVSSLRGTITLQVNPNDTTAASLTAWYASAMTAASNSTAASQPWLLLGPNKQGVTGGTPVTDFQTVGSVLPATYKATAFAGDIDIVGRLTLAPSPTGTLDLLAGGDINGLRINGVAGSVSNWGTAALTLSDADPGRLPGVTTPISNPVYTETIPSGTRILAQVDALFAESGRTNFSLEEKLSLHGQVRDASGKLVPLHSNDLDPVHLYAAGGDLSGLTLYSAKPAQIVASGDISDVAFYVQNLRAGDSTVVAAGRDITAYDPASPLRIVAQQPGNALVGAAGATGPASGTPTAGDIQISGPGTLQVLAGRNLDLGNGSAATKDGTAAGILSIGSVRNPFLPQNSGASVVAAAGVREVYSASAVAAGLRPGLATTNLKFVDFISSFLNPATAGAQSGRYLPELAKLMGLSSTDAATIWAAYGFTAGSPLTERQAALALDIFQLVLRNSARDRNDPLNANFGKYTDGFAAIAALFPGSPQPSDDDLKSTEPVERPAGSWAGNLAMSTRLIKTLEGGNISLLAPGGQITVGRATDPQKPDQGVLTERGGGISIFAADSVNVGTSRIFTLRGGNEILWSTWGNIAAGSGSKTVFSAPPTRVLVDPQSGDVQNDLAGLATGSGIGVLATLSGVKPGDVDLIAPVGTIDAGDAGIRSSGNLNLAARVVLNASNIQVGGTAAGTPPPPPAPNLGSLNAASTASAGASSAATDVAKQSAGTGQVTAVPSLISVEVLGYGGDEEDEDEKKRNASASTEAVQSWMPLVRA